MKIKDLISVTKGKLVKGNVEDEVGNFCRDTRIIKQNDTYIGIKGEKFDGNLLWKDALEKGAKTVIVSNINISSKELENVENKNIVMVEDSIIALGNIAKYKREMYDIPVIGVTGSVGKTSTKDIIASVVSEQYNTLKTEGNNNNNIGLPFTLFRLNNQEAMVIEMGMNHFYEIDYLTKIAQPTISVITNIGTSHIGNLGSRENILKAKLEILNGMKNKILVINNDNDLLHKFYMENRESKDIEFITYGIENQSDIMPQNIELDENTSTFECKIYEKDIFIKIPVGGIHFVYNALCAIAVGKKLGLSDEQIKNGIENFKLTKKRMEIIELKNGVTIINDSYNASFESMQASLKYLNSLENKRKIAILGDMFELGKYSEELHKKVGEEVVKNNINILLCSGENSKNITEIAKLKMNKDNVYYFNSKEEIIEFVKKIWKKDDAILIKASNGMQFFKIVDELEKSEE